MMWLGVAVVGVAIRVCHAMQLCRSRLRKGCDWLMWALLYFSSTVQSKASQPALVFQKEFVPILNLFSLLYQDREVRMDGVWPALMGQGGKEGWGCGLLYQDMEGWGVACSTRTGR